MTVTVPSKIKSIRKIKVAPTPVYDIEVPGFNNFQLSNGLIIHNSKDMADSLAGALINASSYKDEFSLHLSDDYVALTDANDVAIKNTQEDFLSKLTDAVKQVRENSKKDVDKDPSVDLDTAFSQMSYQQSQEIKAAEQRRITKLRSTLSPQENAQVSDDELTSAYYGNDDDMLIF